MTGIVRGVVNDLGIGKTGEKNQAEPEKQGDGRYAQGFASFRRARNRSSRTGGHLISPWLPLRQLE